MIFADLVKLCVEMVRAERKWEVSGKLDDDAWHKLVNLKLDLDQAISPSATEWSRPGRVLLYSILEPIVKEIEFLDSLRSDLYTMPREEVEELIKDQLNQLEIITNEVPMYIFDELLKNKDTQW